MLFQFYFNHPIFIIEFKGSHGLTVNPVSIFFPKYIITGKSHLSKILSKRNSNGLPLSKNSSLLEWCKVLNFSWLEWVLTSITVTKITWLTQDGDLMTLFFYVVIHLFWTFIGWRKLQNVLSNCIIGTLTVKKKKLHWQTCLIVLLIVEYTSSRYGWRKWNLCFRRRPNKTDISLSC